MTKYNGNVKHAFFFQHINTRTDMMQETQRKPVLFRRQRSGLTESMSTAIEVTSLDDIAKILLDVHSGIIKVECNHYGYDSRIDWDTYVITMNGDAVGFTNGPLT